MQMLFRRDSYIIIIFVIDYIVKETAQQSTICNIITVISDRITNQFYVNIILQYRLPVTAATEQYHYFASIIIVIVEFIIYI